MRRVKIFDTTLRDGEQSPGCSMNLPEKLDMARQLEALEQELMENLGFAVTDHEVKLYGYCKECRLKNNLK